MPGRRGTMLVGGVVVLALVQVVYEDLLFFAGATGAAPVTSSPYVLVGVPLVLFLLLAGLLYGWAITTSETLR